MAEKRKQPEWKKPQTKDVLKLELYNSLTRDKNEFVPISQQRLTWYNCGPTVYDSSHMGHARSYITFDIIRRVLRNYFGFNVFFVQNITDIDDKIIRRARQNHLFDKYLQELKQGSKENQNILADINNALAETKAKFEHETDPDKRAMLSKLINNTESTIKDSANNVENMVLGVKDVLSIWLDQNFGHEVCDREIFISLPRFYENEYNQDMNALNILPPDCVTRVSEYVPEIVEYIQKIIENGYAYVSNGSVYFDTEKFAQTPHHYYAKLVPEAFGDSKALAEGEGDLTAIIEEKRNANDFALWKNSKPGEPWWPSPWGQGRPGWHIECSVMASSIIGEQMDIHSGGIDLRFPHHDNEMAQSEAYFNTGRPWVNYFLHSGHLTISGCKMSKSLKNFITIKEALKKISSRQLRLVFLLHSWKDTLDYSDNTMNDAIHFEKNLNEFFLTVKDILRQNSKMAMEKRFVKWNNDERNLYEKFIEHTRRIDQALHDNIDTKKACEEIRRLLSVSNIYIQNKQNQSNPILLCIITQYITRLMDIFGCVSFFDEQQLIGFPQESSNNIEGKEKIILPFIESIAKLRDEIRNIARDLKNKQLFILCDRIRDDIFPELGVRMEDYETSDGQQQWRLKLVDRETLMQERLKRIEEAEQAKRLATEMKQKKLEQAKSEPPPIDPRQMFRLETDKYSQFDDNGMPTHDQDGQELTKSALKKIAKRFQAQEKKYNDYLKKMAEHS
ncbi:cysteine-trna ligase [Dermatophagoides farinae]|uniref:Cysteine--tRNA ligase, cytoplasmic n=1 Tax=Dermatophagoides farinae TaxID=6954 RepID=A0A9D4SHB7_DERFA|nr:cysteine--tRNA ligase, cytoplasmic-like [Dermatophagoides farinae]KAH7642459.1 cysteine-trna ligase [Dermatophagoides farinae]